jgi:MFS family permease
MSKKKIFTPTIVVLSLVSLFNDVSSEMLLPVLPIYLSSIGFSALYIGILEGFAEAVVGLSKGYFGQRSDETGNRVSFVRFGYSLSAVAKPMMALLTYPFWIFLSRTFDRLGKGIRTNARDAMLADESEHEHRGKVFGFHRAMDTVGAAIGPALALVYLYFHPGKYAEVFLLAFIPSVVAVILTFVLKQKEIPKKAEKKTFRFFSYFSYWKEASEQYKKVVPAFLLFALFNSSDAFLILMGKHHGLDDTTIILAYIFFNIVYAALAFPMGRLADKHGMKVSYSIGLLAFIAAYVLIPFASTPLLFFATFFIYSLFPASTDGISRAWITTICSAEAKGTALGFYTSFQSIIALLASSLAGFLWIKLNPPALFFISAAGGVLVLIYMIFFLDVRGKSASVQPT